MNYAHTYARQSSGFARLALATMLLFATVFAAHPALAGDTDTTSTVGMPANLNADLIQLFNSKDHPLPILPVVVGQVDSRAQVEALIAPGQRPTIFQISNVDGPYMAKAKVWMFSEIALEYPNTVNFVKVPAGSEAAAALYPNLVTKPVYVTSNPNLSGSDRFKFIDEGQLKGDLVVNQVTVEALIVKALDVQPALFATYPLTVDNEHKLIYEFQPASPAPTAKWVAVLFFANNEENVGQMNRLRVLVGTERFFYVGRLRMVECDLSTQGQVYQTVINNGQNSPLPGEPQLWIINPDTHQAAQYIPGKDGPPVVELTHDTLQAFLAKNSVAPPPATASAFNTVKAWPELQQLARNQQAAMLTPIRFDVVKP
jgi:hypothetical protein